MDGLYPFALGSWMLLKGSGRLGREGVVDGVPVNKPAHGRGGMNR